LYILKHSSLKGVSAQLMLQQHCFEEKDPLDKGLS